MLKYLTYLISDSNLVLDVKTSSSSTFVTDRDIHPSKPSENHLKRNSLKRLSSHTQFSRRICNSHDERDWNKNIYIVFKRFKKHIFL